MSEPGETTSVGSDRSDRSDRSHSLAQSPPCVPAPKGLRPSGGYRTLRSFQATTIIYDATVSFCARFVDKHSRTTDQMVQAARSGRQNIAEGSRASAASSQTELRLVNVARASLDELLLDYEDYLRQRNLPQWTKNDPEARAVREVGKTSGQPPDAAAYAAWLEHTSPAVAANAVICLIHQANYLLDRQIARLEREFIHQGGYSERLAAARLEERGKQRSTESKFRPDGQGREAPPACPLCAQAMALRTARKGEHAGSRFWGCTAYPACNGTRPLEPG
ncbi:MAG TPA: four helix bundle suffix domain-containing protein [Candidatus Acidoferrum sp.]|nr:four helix bundle suffix domain-containing protein [Candidatus Acidoferrum sp.]